MPSTPEPSTLPLIETVPPQVARSGNAFNVTLLGARRVTKLFRPVRLTPAAFEATTRQ